jgi:uncharacterized damage-inducible protein DinB
MLLKDLPDYTIWANLKTLEMLRKCPSDEAAAIFAHLLGAQTVWADRIDAVPQSAPIRPDWDLETSAAHIVPSAGRYRAFIADVGTERAVTYKNSMGETYTLSLDEILVHVFVHGAYHRGQISQIVRDKGGELIDTDYFLFRREQ